MGLKLFKKNKKKKNEQIAKDAFKAVETPTKVGGNNAAAAAVTTPDTIASPGSPVPQQDYIMEASTPNAMNIERPEPTSFNQRIMESETPLVSNLATVSSVSSQFGRDRSAPRLDNTNTQPLQTKSNQIRDEIGQYYDERDREDARMVSPSESTKMNNTNNVTEKRTLDPIQEVKARSSSPPVTTTYSRQHVDNIGVRAFSTDESEDVEVQLSNHLPGPPNTKTKGGNNTSRHPRGRGLSSKLIPPKFVSKIDHDEVSVPSLITEPETQDVEKPEQTHQQQQQQRSSSTKPSSLDNMIDKGQQSIDDAIKSIFGEGTMKSVATQAGGIENLLGLLQCGGDTVFGCDALCGPGEVEKDAVDLENEQEQQFAMKFNNEIIRDGIKVIYHEPPTKTSSSPDWTQSTVKIFLRPGDCHGKKLLQPSLVWTLLQVASNRFNNDDSASFNTNDKNMWHKLELMDIDSIMVAPEEQLSASNFKAAAKATSSTDAGGIVAVPTSPFFSITTQSTGTVHIFEAASVMERDYIIRGMKGIISRLAFNIIAGNTDVVGEHYSEDAGQMTGELPSLRSPRQAVRDLTHAFLDQ